MNLHSHRRRRRRRDCTRHPPSNPSTGLCASCLRERLSLIDTLALQVINKPTLQRSRFCSDRSISLHPSEPRRYSCDSRGRNTLSDLFVVEDDGPSSKVEDSSLFGVKEVIKSESRPRVRVASSNGGGNDHPTIRQEGEKAEGGWKTVREFIDLERESKKQNGRKGKGFWDLASAFSKKFRKCRHKDKRMDPTHAVDGDDLVKGGRRGGGNLNLRNVKKMRAEVGDYGLGRRSCDTDPRLSVDTGRLSLDGVHCSMDKPRASWDGSLVGRGCQYPRLSSNPMVSFLEDVRVIDVGFKNRMLADGKIDEVAWKSPGGCVQTRDYYNEPISMHKGRRSLDRLNSVRKGSLEEMNDRKLVMNSKISPAANELFYGAKLLIAEEGLMVSSSKSSIDDQMEAKDGSSVVGNIDEKLVKKLHKWGKAWKVLDLIHRRSESKFDGVGSFPADDPGHQQGFVGSEALRKLRIVAQEEANDTANRRFISARSSFHGDGLSLVGSNVENKSIGMNGRDEIWQRNRSMKQSPNNLDNGLLRFYLTPARSYRTKHVRGQIRKAQWTAKGAL